MGIYTDAKLHTWHVADTSDNFGEIVINYQINYSFDVSVNEDFVVGEYVIPKEQASGFAAKWAFFGDEEEIEMDDVDGKKIKVLRPKCNGIYCSDVFDRTEYIQRLVGGRGGD